MSYHSAQVHLAVTRLIAAYGLDASIADLDCRTIDVDGRVAYQIRAGGTCGDRVAHVLRDTLGPTEFGAGLNESFISVEHARKLIESAYC